MAGTSSIEWTDKTWNPVRGCTRVSPGCVNCYAESVAARFSGPGLPYEGLAKRTAGGPRWTGEMSFGHDLDAPLRWRKPSRIFVNSMSDLFHDGLADEQIDRVFAVMALASWHTMQVLTKRSGRMRAYCEDPGTPGRIARVLVDEVLIGRRWPLDPKRPWPVQSIGDIDDPDDITVEWPLPNVWLGVSAEDQQRADERVPDLLATPSAVRFVSAEPLLGPIDFGVAWSGESSLDAECWGDCAWCKNGRPPLHNCQRGKGDWEKGRSGLDWIIVGGESGPKARHLWTPNVRSIVRQCAEAGVACFVKQLGADVRDRNDAGFEGCEPHEWPDVDPADVEHDLDGTRDGYQGAPVRIRLTSRKGNDPSEWPADLRVRQLPGVDGRPAL